jgi:hypothetical protein
MKLCYFCGKKKTSKEHIPPKQIFKGFKINKMTVYSCDEHNSERSGKDEAIIKSMLLAIKNSNNVTITTELSQALNEVKDHYNQVKKTVTKEKIIIDSNEDTVCLDVSIDLDNWIRQLSAGMIYHKIKYFDNGNDFVNSKVFERNSYSKNKKSFEDFQNERNKKIELQIMSEMGEWSNSWIPNNCYPENLYFFRYKIIDNFILIKHVFYKCFVFYNLIEISNKTKELLL